MHPRFTAAFPALPADLQTAIQPLLDSADFDGVLRPQDVARLKQETGLDEDALALALLPIAACCAVAPVSHFNVGAISRGVSGHWYFGANMEFEHAPLQQTVHAEQSAITHAWLRGEEKLDAITVNYTPCGHCRQFMNELNSGTAIRISLPGRAISTLGDYLPDAFGPADLNITERLLTPIDHGFTVQGDDLQQAAIDAANHSHAPYSHSFSGVALRSESGKIFSGRYAENAAFNPSLPPLQAALILMNMSNETLTTIQQAVLAECQGSTLNQLDATRATLSALGCEDFSLTLVSKTSV
ncbi:cytidine deaminase [Pantoea rodasii]|uniref:Cytidine deaminase n=1 Tax=Pantoea rodasii TaxID=1076549 RepID=A0A2M9WG20_9GAMM|nr:cytidine deaminase [Pantoea rodasii]ORM57328.1 cytidine deaminase [Pantoea rodasii]PJZ06503.1 cytidine deaminase [Pantoea rodasii]